MTTTMMMVMMVMMVVDEKKAMAVIDERKKVPKGQRQKTRKMERDLERVAGAEPEPE